MNYYYGIGLMSGTSLDGLDIAHVEFRNDGRWHYQILDCQTIPYESALKQQLQDCFHYSAPAFQKFHHDYGTWLGKQVNDFIHIYGAGPQYIASHGHTIFHDPQQGYSTQIGCGANIYAATGLSTVCDFRTVDIAFGGQGAPLVPVGDLELFPQYQFLLNLGGIANITMCDKARQQTRAYDITVANMALNYYAAQLGAAYDAGGLWARAGQLQPALLEALNAHAFFAMPAPKSLGREFFEREFLPILERYPAPSADLLHTLCWHIATQVALTVHNQNPTAKMLVTGGGALNEFLIACIQQKCQPIEVVVPDKKTIEFKEALIFAFLGLLRLKNLPNSLARVTGAVQNALGGALYGPIPQL